jgi:hypothetical protein
VWGRSKEQPKAEWVLKAPICHIVCSSSLGLYCCYVMLCQKEVIIKRTSSWWLIGDVNQSAYSSEIWFIAYNIRMPTYIMQSHRQVAQFFAYTYTVLILILRRKVRYIHNYMYIYIYSVVIIFLFIYTYVYMSPSASQMERTCNEYARLLVYGVLKSVYAHLDNIINKTRIHDKK